MEGALPVYLKAARIDTDHRLVDEADRLRWMRQHDLPVPAVVDAGRVGTSEYLLLEEIPGRIASDSDWTSVTPEVIAALGSGLARLHRTRTWDCPFDQRLDRQIDAARRRVATGRVREDDFDEIRAGRRATDLLDELLATIPASEDIVFTHGDFCLPNIILDRGPTGDVIVAGLIDCGRAGLADRHQDVALAVRSIVHNFGSDWVAPFLRAHGLPNPEEEKLRFFTLLDEFF